ncbi:Type III restriction-modification system methylation subunit [Burkholderia cenocepacia KC-01]|nr:Type III restriction-modification system methylation subunit [Burkholderia cenocepacia KC-01]
MALDAPPTHIDLLPPHSGRTRRPVPHFPCAILPTDTPAFDSDRALFSSFPQPRRARPVRQPARTRWRPVRRAIAADTRPPGSHRRLTCADRLASVSGLPGRPLPPVP